MKVDIQTTITISCNDGKANPVPANLIQDHGGRHWLKLRPTSQPLNQITYQLWARGAAEDKPEENVYEESGHSTQRPRPRKEDLMTQR